MARSKTGEGSASPRREIVGQTRRPREERTGRRRRHGRMSCHVEWEPHRASREGFVWAFCLLGPLERKSRFSLLRTGAMILLSWSEMLVVMRGSPW